MTPKILIVDDIPTNVHLLVSMLMAEGYEYEYASDGREAIEAVKDQDFDLILLDVMMPGIDGFEACKQIKQMPEKRDIPIVFITAKSDTESIAHGFTIGGVDYISKPFNTTELLARIQTHIDLKISKQELKTLNKDLEQKVKDRTRQLVEAHNQLTKAHEELQVLDQAKTEFLRIVNHELRTPLNGILGFAELLNDNPDASDIPSLVAGLNRSASRLEKLAFTAMNITNLQVNQNELSNIEVNLKECVQKCKAAVSPKLEGKAFNLELALGEKDYIVHGDEKLIVTCLQSVVENSIEHAEPKNYIKIEIAEDNGFVCLKVSDDGVGFSQATLDKPFKLFNPGSDFVNTNTGLGLALSKLVLDAHNGKIIVANNDNGGAETNLCFPTI